MKSKEEKLVGRPPLFDTPEALKEKIAEYFEEGMKTRTVIIGKAPNQTTIEIEVPTITGLCLYLGFESRQSFYAYEKKEGFSYTIKRARLSIENEYEEQLQCGNTVGAIFALKNMGWYDRQEITGKDGKDFALTAFNYIAPQIENGSNGTTNIKTTHRISETSGQDN